MEIDFPFFAFEQAIGKVGLSSVGLKVEGFRTDGTSNYLANLNYRGQTWAAALRLPAIGASVEEFLTEKKRALTAVDYLIKVLATEIDVGFHCALKFGGVSCFAEASSVQSFLQTQGRETPLTLIDRVYGRERKIEGFRYPEALPDDTRRYVSDYAGPFYLSRGAPAWETLEEYPELEEPVAHALSALHLATGKGTPVLYESALNILRDVEAEMLEGCKHWSPSEGSKEQLALAKSLKKWKAEDDNDRSLVVRRERFLRTSAGKAVYESAFARATTRHPLPSSPLVAFCHGDCHGGNFILVRYQFAISRASVLLDRVFLNEIFERNAELVEVYVTIDDKAGTITHDLRPSKDHSTLRATRKLHHEVHLIDLDNGHGTTDDTKVLHLYDAVSYAISLANLTRLFASPLDSGEVLSHYYDGLRRRA